MKIFVTVLVAGILFVQGNDTHAQLSRDTVLKLDALFAGRPQDEPGGVLVITRYGKPIYRKVFGAASMELGTPLSAESVFQAASVSKQFTAAAVLLLVANGRLSLQDDIRKYIPELPDYGSVINIRHLLTHTSGLKDWRNVSYITSWPTGYKLYTQQYAIRTICRQKSLNYQPGERYSYTNAGYDLSGILVERLTGQSFADFVKDSLLLPAGMTQSTFERGFTNIVKNMASGYRSADNGYELTHILDETYGAAGLLTTAGDLAKWNQFIHNSETGKRIAALRLQRYVLNNGDTISYANGGVNVYTVNGVREITHSGLLGGYRALVAYYPSAALSVSYMSNNKDISTVELKKDIAAIFFGEEKKDDLWQVAASNAGRIRNNKKSGTASTNGATPAGLDKKAGVYLNVEDESDMIKLHVHEGKLMSYAAILDPVSADVFKYEKNLYRFLPGGDSVVLNRAGEDARFYRVSSFTPAANELKPYTGIFYSADGDVTVNIQLVRNRLVLYRDAGDSVILAPVFQLNNQFVFRGFDHGLRATYFFTKEQNGAVRSFYVSLPRAARIPFTRKEQ